MTKQINWGIIGCGNVTEKKSGPAFNKVDESKLQVVMRRNVRLVQEYAKRHHVPQYTTNAEAIFNNPEINAVYVATPPGNHAEYAIKAMQAGKTVYVEKPMAATYAQCQEMLKVSKQTGVPIYVAYYRRSLPGFLKAKELVAEGRIGTPVYVNIRLVRPANDYEKNSDLPIWRLQKELSGGGIFFDLASHQLDYLDYLFGPIKQAKGIAVNRGGFYDVEDTVSASFVHENGVVGNGIWSFVTDESAREDVLEIIGTKGKIVMSSFAHTPVHMYVDGKDYEYPYLNPENIQYNLIRQVVHSMQGRGSCASTGESAARTNKVLEEIVKDFYQK